MIKRIFILIMVLSFLTSCSDTRNPISVNSFVECLGEYTILDNNQSINQDFLSCLEKEPLINNPCEIEIGKQFRVYSQSNNRHYQNGDLVRIFWAGDCQKTIKFFIYHLGDNGVFVDQNDYIVVEVIEKLTDSYNPRFLRKVQN